MMAETTDAPLELPELNQAVLDGPTVDQLFSDVAQCTQVVEIILKQAPCEYVGQEAVTLETARQLLQSGAIRGAQIRYRYENAEWWDTLIRVGNEIRLTRIRHDFSSVTPT